MKISIKYYFTMIVCVAIIASCESVSEPESKIDPEPFLNEIEEIVVPMNGISSFNGIKINEKRFDTNKIYWTFFSSDTSLVDNSNIMVETIIDSISFFIKPKLGKHGETNIILIVSDSISTDTTKFTVNVTYDERNNEYPTLLFPKSTAELEKLRRECPYEIDDYGLISFGGTLARGNSSIVDADKAVDLVKKEIVQYSKFTNVFDESSLMLESAKRSSSSIFTDWVVIFKEQNYNGIDVFGPQIITIVHNSVASIKGHHLNNIYIPEENIIPIERVKELLIGKKFEYQCWETQELVITKELLSDDIVQNIYWIDNIDHKEFRIIWKVPIYQFEYDSYAGFYIFVDALSGEILRFILTFKC